MRKIKEVLRLRFALGLGQREIARACSISQGAVHNYLKRAAGAGMRWPLPEGWDEKQIEEAVFGKQRSIEESSQRAFPDFPALHNQLQQHAHLTLQLAWEEYRSGAMPIPIPAVKPPRTKSRLVSSFIVDSRF